MLENLAVVALDRCAARRARDAAGRPRQAGDCLSPSTGSARPEMLRPELARARNTIAFAAIAVRVDQRAGIVA